MERRIIAIGSTAVVALILGFIANMSGASPPVQTTVIALSAIAMGFFLKTALYGWGRRRRRPHVKVLRRLEDIPSGKWEVVGRGEWNHRMICGFYVSFVVPQGATDGKESYLVMSYEPLPEKPFTKRTGTIIEAEETKGGGPLFGDDKTEAAPFSDLYDTPTVVVPAKSPFDD